MMVAWIQSNQYAEVDFSVIPFQTRFLKIQQVPEPGTGRMVDQEVDEWHTHQAWANVAIKVPIYKSGRDGI